METAPRLSASSLVRRLGPAPALSGRPAYGVLAHRIRAAVLDGRVAVSTGLPSERQLAAALSLSRTTVTAAYAALREDGWLDSRRGSGSRLMLPIAPQPGPPPGPNPPAGRFGAAGSEHADVIDLSVACPSAELEPLAAALAGAAAELSAYAGTDGYAPFGLSRLRERIAQRYTAAGAPTRADQILVTNGAQHAFSLCLLEFCEPGRAVLVECPTYPVALDAIRAAHRIPVPFGLTGLAEPTESSPGRRHLRAAWDLDLFGSTIRQMSPRLAYLMPDFQNPTGALLDEAGRRAVIAAARGTGTVLLIDESFREVPFGDPADLPAPMAALGDPDQVISLGSMSKSFWAGLRMGWIRASTARINRLAAARALTDMSGSVLDQLVAWHLLADPERFLARHRERLASGAAALLQVLAAEAPDWLPTEPAGGACLWVRLPGPFATELARLASGVGVRIAPGPRFGPDGTMDGYLRLPFTAPIDRLTDGVRRLVAVADRAAARPAVLSGWIA